MLPTGASSPDDGDLDLRSYLGVLQRRWRAVVAVAAVCVVAAIGLSLRQEPLYRASAELLIAPRSTDSLFVGANNRVDLERQLNNEVEVLESGAIAAAVEEVYDGFLDPDDVSASVPSEATDLVSVSLTAADADEAANLVNVYVDTYIETRRQQRRDELLSAQEDIQTRLTATTDQLAVLTPQLDAAQAALEEDPDNDAAATDVESLQGQISPLLSRQTFYQQQVEDLALSADVASTGGAEVLTRARTPQGQIAPKPTRDGLIALILGLGLGVGVAFVLENLDERIRGTSDLERATSGLPTLALVPETDAPAAPNFIAARDDPLSNTAEAFRSLRTAVKFAAIDKPINVIQIASPAAGEGKTTAVTNLGVALAQGGDRVVLVDCDLRRPTLHERFELPPVPGFTDVLVGDVALSSALRRYDSGADDLHIMVLPAGSHAPNPSELLSTTRAAGVVAALSEEFDFVVLDSTPVLPVTDSLVVSRLADATLLVVDARSTRRNAVRRSLQLLWQVNAPVLGVVLNGLNVGGYGYGYGGYGYGGYSPDAERLSTRKPADPSTTATA